MTAAQGQNVARQVAIKAGIRCVEETATYIANAHIGFNIPWTASYSIGLVFAIAYVVALCLYCLLYTSSPPGTDAERAERYRRR